MLHITNVYSLGTVTKGFMNIRSYERLKCQETRDPWAGYVLLQCMRLKPVCACISKAVGLHLPEPRGPWAFLEVLSLPLWKTVCVTLEMRPREKDCLVTQVCMVQFPFLLPRGHSWLSCWLSVSLLVCCASLTSLLMLSSTEDRLLTLG